MRKQDETPSKRIERFTLDVAHGIGVVTLILKGDGELLGHIIMPRDEALEFAEQLVEHAQKAKVGG